jgi:hypothetical protein
MACAGGDSPRRDPLAPLTHPQYDIHYRVHHSGARRRRYGCAMAEPSNVTKERTTQERDNDNQQQHVDYHQG